MILARLLLRHTRHGSPTRRLAVQRFSYPEDVMPHAAAVLLGGVAVAHLARTDDATLDAYDALLDDVADDAAMPRRALRYRVQTDVVGLTRSEHRLVVEGESLRLEVDHLGPAVPQLVGALVAVSQLRGRRRRLAIDLMRTAREMTWSNGAAVAAMLLNGAEATVLTPDRPKLSDDERRALGALGFDKESRPTRSEVLAAFRRHVRAAHPDHGAEREGAGARVAQLAEARAVLLGRC